LKAWVLKNRVEDLSEKLTDTPEERGARIDFSSFSEPEKALIRKIWDLQAEYGENLPSEVLEANKELVFKANEIFFKYVMNTLKFTMLCFMGDPESEIHKWYFNLHFYNFFVDLNECLDHVKNWPEKEHEWFLSFLKENGMKDKVYRFPRGSADFKTKVRTQENSRHDRD
jgi:hypothetical protein